MGQEWTRGPICDWEIWDDEEHIADVHGPAPIRHERVKLILAAPKMKKVLQRYKKRMDDGGLINASCTGLYNALVVALADAGKD